MNDLTSDQWKRVEAIFDEAADMEDARRDAFLDEACDGDAAVRREVEAMLRAEARSASFLATPAVPVPPLGDGADAAAGGRRIGPYRLVRRIGVGGMGSVWLAERDDEHFARRVAIKLIRRGMDTVDILARFRRERQVLARLEHPNIARLYDGGATEDGRPYLAMEYVDGVPIDVFCDEHHLSIDERLELFRKVCLAVHYAHQNLVVHRDLKPGNVLVEEATKRRSDEAREGPPPAPSRREGGSDAHPLSLRERVAAKRPGEGGSRGSPVAATPKLLDFGISKVLGAEGSAGSLDVTATEARLLTPRYASPEQIRGEPVTTASDVYSLGVILYELLTGRPPYEPASRSRHDYERAICEVDPTRPSTAVTRPWARAADDGTTRTVPAEALSVARSTEPRGLRRRLDGDLDTIVLMALRKEPERRYHSAEQLAEDVRRHLASQPVSARPDTFRYRAGKFVRRNRLGVGAAAVVLLAIVGALIASSTMYVRAERARVAAEAAQAQEATQREIALVEADAARAAEAQASRRAYAAGLQAAAAAIESRQVAVAASYLDAQPPALRGWEWSMLANRLDRSERRWVAPGERSGYASLALSPDGGLLAAGGFDGRVRLWDTGTGEPIGELGPHVLWANTLAFAPDGTTIAVGEGSWIGGRLDSAAIRLWDVRTGEPSGTLEGHADSIQSVVYAPDGSALVSASSDLTIRVWDVRSRAEIARLDAHGGQVQAVAYSSDGLQLASAAWDGTARLWNATTWAPIRTIRTEPMRPSARPSSVTLSPDGTLLATGSRGGRVRVWRSSTGELIETIEFHGSDVGSLVFSLDGTRLYTASTDDTVGSLDLVGWREHRAWLGHEGDATAVCLSIDGRTIYSAGADGAVRSWRADTSDVASIRTRDWVTGMALTPDGERLALQGAAVSRDEAEGASALTIDVLAVPDATPLQHVVLAPGESVNGLAWSSDGSRLAVATGETMGVVWSAASGELVHVAAADAFSWSVAFGPDDRLVAIACDDGYIRLVAAADGAPVGEPIECARGPAAKVAFAGDGRVVTIDREGRPVLRDLAGARANGATLDVDAPASTVVVSPDGAEAVVGLADGTALVWDLATGRVRGTLPDHGDTVTAAAWSPDGRRLFTSTLRAIVKVWDGDRLDELMTLRPGAQRMAMTPDGRWLISAASNGEVRFWDGGEP